MLRTKTTLRGTGSINADNRGTEPAFVGVVACSGSAVGLRKIGSPPLEKNGEGTKNHLQKGGESVPT
jgi:hypothetical protein